jgi:hypothetical protein
MEPLAFRLRIFLIVLSAVLALGTLGFVAVEGLSLTDAIYFSVVTVATVGYGDIHPATPLGKLLAIILIVTGVGTFLGVIGNATEMMLNRREKRNRAQKLNMVIGLFYSEVGTQLMARLTKACPRMDRVRRDLVITGDWSDGDFLAMDKSFGKYDFTIDTSKIDLEDLKGFLGKHKSLLLRLLENPALLENEAFTELLRASFHLNDELLNRRDLRNLPASDVGHLAGDLKRVYTLLVKHWLVYMKHLKDNYPYLFSLAMRTNPFDKDATPVVT